MTPPVFLGGKLMTTTEEKSTVKEKLFRLKPEEDARLPKLIEYAQKAGYIKKASFQEFMIFAINCAYTRLKSEYEQTKGRR